MWLAKQVVAENELQVVEWMSMWLAKQVVAENELTGGGVDVNVDCYAGSC